MNSSGHKGDFPFHQRDFAFIAALMHDRAGIALEPHKHEMVYARLSKRLRALEIPSFHEYCALLSSPEGRSEVDAAVNALTTNLTRFFREPHHFDHLEKVAIPELAATKQAQANGRKRLRLWSAACSTGEEAYSMAIILAAALRDLAHWDARILATDIDTNVLEIARQGFYDTEHLSFVPRHHLIHSLDPEPARDGRFRIARALRSLVAVKALNIVGSWPMKGPFDVVFCRNMIIYFDKPTQQTLFERLANIIAPGGYLYIGHSESLFGLTDRFELVGHTTYRRRP